MAVIKFWYKIKSEQFVHFSYKARAYNLYNLAFLDIFVYVISERN